MNKQLAKLRQLHSDFSVDEQMVPYTGMNSSKQCMKDKSIRVGCKNVVLTESDGGDPAKDLTRRITVQLALEIPDVTGSLLYSLPWSCYIIGHGHWRKINTVFRYGQGPYRKDHRYLAGVCIVKWMDNNVVRLGSNVDGAEPKDSVSRFSRQQNNKLSIDQPKIV